MAIHGSMGKVLFVDLTTGTCSAEELPEKLYRDYMGGDGLGVRILYERMRPHVDPLGPDNMLGFVAGPLVGTKCHGAGRFSVVAKSPLTGGWGDANCGGNFGPMLKKAGYDGIFFTGKADKPVYLYVDNEVVEIRDAAHLWGKSSSETEKMLLDELGTGVRVVSIGQAGEKQSLIASIMHHYGRAAGRSGLGAVMGSKMLKALVVSGNQKVPIADEAAYENVLQVMKADIDNKTRLAGAIGRFGTAGAYGKFIAAQDAPVHNWKGLSSEEYPIERAAKLTGESYDKYKKRRYACAQCHIGCGAILEAPDTGGSTYQTHRPEYETIAAFGSLCLVDDIEMVMKVNEMCNLFGLDTISTGATVAFALECFEQGALTLEDTEGLALEWGNTESIIRLVDMMGKREGIGAVFADGVKKASERVGKGSEAYAIHISGQEPPMHDPRCWPGFGSGYALDPTPGRHTRSALGLLEHGWRSGNLTDLLDQAALIENRYDIGPEKGRVSVILDHWLHCISAAGLCVFTEYGYNSYPLVDALKAVAGWQDFSRDEGLVIGERIHTLRHCFNVREGISPDQFVLPKRIQGDPPFQSGPTAGVTLDVDLVKRAYFAELDWDIVTGKPSQAKLAALGLADLINDLP